jgi:hypothetical protein
MKSENIVMLIAIVFLLASEYMLRRAARSKGLPVHPLQQIEKLVERYTRLTHYCSQSPFGDFAMVWNDQSAKRRRRYTKNHVATGLSVKTVAAFFERANQVETRNARQGAQTVTSMTSSSTGGGIGSPCALRLSR